MLALLLVAVFPAYTGHVVDTAQVIEPRDAEQIEAVCERLDKAGTAQIAVATVRDLGELDRKQYATELFQRWKLGHSKQQSDGLLLLFSPARSGKFSGLKVEVGYGLEGVLPDGKVGALMDQAAGPLLRQQRVGPAALALVIAFAGVIDPKHAEAPPQEVSAPPLAEESRAPDARPPAAPATAAPPTAAPLTAARPAAAAVSAPRVSPAPPARGWPDWLPLPETLAVLAWFIALMIGIPKAKARGVRPTQAQYLALFGSCAVAYALAASGDSNFGRFIAYLAPAPIFWLTKGLRGRACPECAGTLLRRELEPAGPGHFFARHVCTLATHQRKVKPA